MGGGSPGGAAAAASVGWEAWLDREWVRRLRVLAVRGAWMQAASCGVISFFTLSRSMGKIFCTNASSCCLNSRAGYLASTFNTAPSISDGCCGASSASAPVPASCHSPEGCPVSLPEVSERHAMSMSQQLAVRAHGAHLAEATHAAGVDGGLQAGPAGAGRAGGRPAEEGGEGARFPAEEAPDRHSRRQRRRAANHLAE